MTALILIVKYLKLNSIYLDVNSCCKMNHNSYTQDQEIEC